MFHYRLLGAMLAVGVSSGSATAATPVRGTAVMSRTVAGSRTAANAVVPTSVRSYAWRESLLHFFGDTPSDGKAPEASLIQAASGELYGTTVIGGGNSCNGSGCGTVFKLTPPTMGQNHWTETVLHAFTGPDGYYLKPVS